jgi:hypothetical protein
LYLESHRCDMSRYWANNMLSISTQYSRTHTKSVSKIPVSCVPYPMLSVFLYSPFLNDPLVFSNVYSMDVFSSRMKNIGWKCRIQNCYYRYIIVMITHVLQNYISIELTYISLVFSHVGPTTYIPCSCLFPALRSKGFTRLSRNVSSDNPETWDVCCRPNMGKN